MSSVSRRMHKVYEDSTVLPFDANSKIILMSDCHRGQGNTNDNFLPNQSLYYGALEHYYHEGFTYIELGDGDELWANRKMQPIIEAHSDSFRLISQFYQEKRFHMLYGNHDAVKGRANFALKNCTSFYCDHQYCMVPLFPDLQIHEGLILECAETKERLFLVHGHQGSLLNDTLWPLARFLVRYVWGPLQLVGFHAPTGASRSNTQKEKIEKQIAAFASEIEEIVIAGHTHRPVFPEPGTSFYFNDGSCVHPMSITGIEIENNAISLIKWSVQLREDQSLYVGRSVLSGPVCLPDFYQAACQ